jgi:protease YdgD
VGVDVTAMPWAATGRLQVPGVSRCTAVMIDPHWAVTAAHCLGAKVLGHVAPPSAVHLLLGYVDGAYTRHLQPDAIRADPAGAADPEGHRGSDLALLHFATAVAAVLPVDTAPQIPGAPLALGGYEQDRAERLAVDPACEARGYQADADRKPLLLHDCTATRGASGGAVLSRPGGVWHLAGVTEAANGSGAGGLAVPGFVVAQMLQSLR